MGTNPKERRVVECRKLGMTYKQIATEVQISVRDIKPILGKYGVDDSSEYTSSKGLEGDSESLMSISSRAYKLFEEFETPLDVAKALNIRAPEAMKYHDEFLELNGRGILAKLFRELNEKGISWVLRLYAIAKAKKMSINQIIECVSIYGEDLPMIKQLCEDANHGLEANLQQEYECEIRVDYLNHLIEKLADDVKSKQTQCEKADESRGKILELTLRLRGVISEFKDNNRTYRRIEEFVGDSVDRILRDANNMKLLEFALISVLRSLPRSDQYKFRYLLHRLDLVEVPGSFDMANDVQTMNSTIPRIDSNSTVVRNSNPQNAHHQYHHSYLTSKNDHCPACYEKEILAMSRAYFEMLKKQVTDEIMATISKENLSSF
jgi:hypothetical protein